MQKTLKGSKGREDTNQPKSLTKKDRTKHSQASFLHLYYLVLINNA